MWTRSGDIRDQSRKLSEIAQNFGRFFGPRKFLGAGLPKIVPSLSLRPRGTSTEKKFREDTPSSPEVIEPNKHGLFPAGTPGNGVPKVIFTVGTAFPGTK